MDLIGLTVEEARQALVKAGYERIVVREERNDKQGRADTWLVTRVRVEGNAAELIADPFLMKV